MSLRRPHAIAVVLPCLLAGTLVAGCRLTPEKLPEDLPQVEGQQIRYRPEGCDYEVTTPPVEHATRGFNTVGEKPAPDHIHVAWAGPTSTTFAVNWRTDTATLVSEILYGTDREAVEAAQGPGGTVSRRVGHALLYGSSLDLGGKEGREAFLENGTRVHEAHVCGLTPSTRYFYKVGGAGTWSRTYGVLTGPAPGSSERFRFALAGDSRNRMDVWAAVANAVAAHSPDFQVFTGDAVNLGPFQEHWNLFFEASPGGSGRAVQEILPELPFVLTNGNHEALSVNYVAQFPAPQQMSEGEAADAVGKEWFSFDYGNAHFVVLNDTTSTHDVITGPQARWLRADLEAVDRTRTPWVFAMHHRPMYSCGATHGSDRGLRAAWQPLYDELGVDFVFNGHVHNYERSLPVRGLSDREPILAAADGSGLPLVTGGVPSGTVYVVTGGAGAPLYDVRSGCAHTYLTSKIEHYIIVDIEGRTMSYTAYRLDGSVLDQFSYTK